MKSTIKIIPRIFGGLGNQLFCYAAARRLALVNDVELAIDDMSGFVRDAAYTRQYHLDHFQIPCRKATAAERLEPMSLVRRYFKRAFNRCMPFEKRTYIQQEHIDFDARLLKVISAKTTYLEGYWQSENYFKDVENVIRKDLTITPPTDRQNQEIAVHMREVNSVAVHMRFFDSPGGGGINNMTGDYYTRALEKMEQMNPNAHYFLFSDNPSAAKTSIPLPEQRITCISHNQGEEMTYGDMWLMTQCQHFIIANSTFSWWGAWLASHMRKQVIAPGFEIRQGKMWWGFRGLIPDRWIKV